MLTLRAGRHNLPGARDAVIRKAFRIISSDWRRSPASGAGRRSRPRTSAAADGAAWARSCRAIPTAGRARASVARRFAWADPILKFCETKHVSRDDPRCQSRRRSPGALDMFQIGVSRLTPTCFRWCSSCGGRGLPEDRLAAGRETGWPARIAGERRPDDVGLQLSEGALT